MKHRKLLHRVAYKSSALPLPQTIGGVEHYRPIYVHAKVAIIDDLWSTVGSANLNNRGMRDDTEMNVATLDAELAQDLRCSFGQSILGLLSADDFFSIELHSETSTSKNRSQSTINGTLTLLKETLGDPYVSLRLMTEHAQDNLRRYKAKLPLIGQLLPYLTEKRQLRKGFLSARIMGGSKNQNSIAEPKNTAHFERYMSGIFAL